MGIEEFNGETFVAFLDICGFKELLKTREKARSALDRFFNVVYREATQSENRSHPVNCIAVSDCAVAFVGESQAEVHNREDPNANSIDLARLVSILKFVRNVAKDMISGRIAINGTIAFGKLEFLRRREGSRTVKAMFLGDAYLSAFSDVVEGRPHLKLGQIRIIPREKVKEVLSVSLSIDNEVSLVKVKRGGYYFYWMLDSIKDIPRFEREFDFEYNKLYDPVISVLKGYSQGTHCQNNQQRRSIGRRASR